MSEGGGGGLCDSEPHWSFPHQFLHFYLVNFLATLQDFLQQIKESFILWLVKKIVHHNYWIYD